MKPIKFNFRFKEDRTYVHGTDLFSESIKILNSKGVKKISEVDFSIHSVMTKQLIGDILPVGEIHGFEKYACVFAFKSNGEKQFLGFKETTEEILSRYSYHEGEIVAKCLVEIENKSIHLSKELDFSNIEKIVAMNKALHEKLFPNVGGKWYFTRLKLKDNFDKESYNNYKITLIRNLKLQLTKSEIYVDGELVGYIFFSLHK